MRRGAFSLRREGVNPAQTPCELFRFALHAAWTWSHRITTGVDQSSNCAGQMSLARVRLAFALHALLPRFRFAWLGEGGVGSLHLAAALVVRDREAPTRG